MTNQNVFQDPQQSQSKQTKYLIQLHITKSENLRKSQRPSSKIFNQGVYQCIPTNQALQAKFLKNYYCSDCTINYAVKNFKIIKVSTGEIINSKCIPSGSSQQTINKTPNDGIMDSNQRQVQVENLRKQTNQIKFETQQSKQDYALRIQNSEHNLDEYLFVLEENYKKLIDIIENAKYRKQQQIINQKNQQKKNGQSHLQQLDKNLEEINTLLKNHQQGEHMFRDMADDHFKAVIEQWAMRIQGYNSFNKQIKKQIIPQQNSQNEDEISKFMNHITNKVGEFFHIKQEKTAPNNKYKSPFPIQQYFSESSHQKTKSEVPSSPLVFQNEDQKQKHMDFIRDKKKRSQGDISLSPIGKKEYELRVEPSHSFIQQDNRVKETNNYRCHTPTGKDYQFQQPKMYASPSNRDLSQLRKPSSNQD